jgi:hypothetical protein
MAEHVHGCLSCRPDMVPDFSKDDPRHNVHAFISGIEISYTRGIFEGREGWVLYAGDNKADEIHPCPCSRASVCVEPRFGGVTVLHDCPSDMAAQLERAKEALRVLAPDRWIDILYGEGS